MNYEERDTDATQKGNLVGGAGVVVGQGPGPELMAANTLMGNDVYNLKNENLGDIKEIMLDMRTGQVSFAVLSFGGFLGMGEKLFAVRWGALTLDTQNKRFTLNVDKDGLESAPEFDQDSGPNIPDPSWEKSIHDYYGTEPLAGDVIV